MNSVVDTLRFSEKLQTSGFASEQVNALARALADELGEQLGAKDDGRGLQGSIDSLENSSETQGQDVVEIKGDIKEIHAKFDGLERRLDFTLVLIGLLLALKLVPVVRPFTG